MGMCICFLLHLERHIKLNISRPSAASEGSESEKDLLLFCCPAPLLAILTAVGCCSKSCAIVSGPSWPAAKNIFEIC